MISELRWTEVPIVRARIFDGAFEDGEVRVIGDYLQTPTMIRVLQRKLFPNRLCCHIG